MSRIEISGGSAECDDERALVILLDATLPSIGSGSFCRRLEPNQIEAFTASIENSLTELTQQKEAKLELLKCIESQLDLSGIAMENPEIAGTLEKNVLGTYVTNTLPQHLESTKRVVERISNGQEVLDG